MHPNDEFHPPTNDDPYWSETNWFAFGVPERKLSGWLYPFFRPALGVCSAAVLLWDDQGDQVWNCRYYKQFWHLPMPDGPLSDFTLANGLHYRCTEDELVYQLTSGDPDGDPRPRAKRASRPLLPDSSRSSLTLVSAAASWAARLTGFIRPFP